MVHNGGPGIATVYHKTNVHLIAAAPDLLDMLQAAAGWIDANREDETTGEGQQAKQLLDDIHTIIKSAQGGKTR